MPPASLKELTKHAVQLDQRGLQYFEVVSKIGFTGDSYPHMVFGPVRVLSEDEQLLVLELRDGAQVSRVLSETPAEANAMPQQAQTTPAAKTAPADPYDALQRPTTKAPAKAPVTTEVKKPAEAKAAEPAAAEDDDAEEKAALKALEDARAKKKAKPAVDKPEAKKPSVEKAEAEDAAPAATAVPRSFATMLDDLP